MSIDQLGIMTIIQAENINDTTGKKKKLLVLLSYI